MFKPQMLSVRFGRIQPVAVVGTVWACGVGCVIMDEDGKGHDDAPPQSEMVTWTPSEADTGSAPEVPSVMVEWGETAIRVEVSDGEDWQLGMAETGGSCGDEVSCWTGEDCHLGFTTSEGERVGPYCHAVEDGGASLTYGGDWLDLKPGTTVFQPSFERTVTYVLMPVSADDTCLTFGHDVRYFQSLGCTTLTD